MNANEYEKMHAALDENVQGSDKDGSDLAQYREALGHLAECSSKAPPGFSERVMAALPAHPDLTWLAWLRQFWPEQGRWFAPALAGAMASAMILAAVSWIASLETRKPSGQIVVSFELHAPTARQVELVGSFNNWKTGQIVLKGPDVTGRWTAEVPLAPGRYEYLFWVDGKTWVVDAAASMKRPDGFGRINAVIDI